MTCNFVRQFTVLVVILFHTLEVNSVLASNSNAEADDERSEYKKFLKLSQDKGRKFYDRWSAPTEQKERVHKNSLEKIVDGVYNHLTKLQLTDVLKRAEKSMKKEQTAKKSSNIEIQDKFKGFVTELLTKGKKVEKKFDVNETDSQVQNKKQGGWSWIEILKDASKLSKKVLAAFQKGSEVDENNDRPRERRDAEEDWYDGGDYDNGDYDGGDYDKDGDSWKEGGMGEPTEGNQENPSTAQPETAEEKEPDETEDGEKGPGEEQPMTEKHSRAGTYKPSKPTGKSQTHKPADECPYKDTEKDCPKRARQGRCVNETDLMLYECRKSCLCKKRSTKDTCDKVLVGVPQSVKKIHNLHDFYKKYTQVYGVPIVSSEKVSDAALKRACYVVKFLLADRRDIRNAFYYRQGRGGVIGTTEKTRSIPEHSYLPKDWDDTTRGLGGTREKPVSTGGEENLLCKSEDSYPNEDIFLHEFTHGIMIIAVSDAIPDFEDRLTKSFEIAKKLGRWKNTYAITDYREYFAEGVQSYFDVNDEAIPANGVHNEVNTRSELEGHDPDLYALIEEVFPCGNTIKKRCDKDGKTPVLKMNCKVKEIKKEKKTGDM